MFHSTPSAFDCAVTTFATAACMSAVATAGVTADAVVSYSPGVISSSALQQNANAALGLPTATDDGDTTPFTPPFRASKIAIVGAGGHVTLHLSSPVVPVDGPDLGVFTNTGFAAAIAGGVVTAATAPSGGPAVFSSDFAAVSVSQDNVTWIPLHGGNAMDLTMPSNAFIDSTFSGTGALRATGGRTPSDPFQPFTASLSQFAGLTYPQMVTLFDGSFGGAWVDVSASGLPEINYVRFDVPAGRRLVIDALTAVPEPTTLAMLVAGLVAIAGRRR